MSPVNRSSSSDQKPEPMFLGTLCRYQVSFIRNAAGELVSDRRFNTSSILATYLGPDAVGPERIAWDVDNPNRLKLALPGRLPPAQTALRTALHLSIWVDLSLALAPGLESRPHGLGCSIQDLHHSGACLLHTASTPRTLGLSMAQGPACQSRRPAIITVYNIV